MDKSSEMEKIEKEIKVFTPTESKLEDQKEKLESLQDQIAEFREKSGIKIVNYSRDSMVTRCSIGNRTEKTNCFVVRFKQNEKRARKRHQ